MILYNFLPTVNADYPYEFPISSYESLSVSGGKNTEVHSGYGVSEERIQFSGQTKFYILLNFSIISETDEELLTNFFHDEDKANGIYNTFYFTPVDTYGSEQHTYVVRFGASIDSAMQNVKRYGLGQVKLVVLGKKLD